jgi:predicted  nucleic acid-binding Zn-ribbon protein
MRVMDKFKGHTDHIAELEAKNTELHAWADSMLQKIEDLETRLTATQEYGTQARLRENKAEDARVHLSFELEKVRAQIAAKDDIIREAREVMDALEAELVEARAQIARQDNHLLIAANIWQDRAEKAEAQIAEHKHKNEGVGWWEREGGV